MARARNIKPGFFKNEVLAELGAFDRLLFIGLWCLADREGRIEDRPKRIKMELFPCDDYQVEHGLQALQQAGFIERYTCAEIAVIEVVNFAKHQSPHGTEKDSELPDRNGDFTVHERSKNGCVTGTKRKANVDPTLNNVNPSLDNALNPDSLNPDSLIPDSPNPEEQEHAAADATVAAEGPEKPPIPDQPKTSRGTRLPKDWTLPADWLAWALNDRPEFPTATMEREGQKFADHWRAATGKNATKLDWFATWRNWVRNARLPQSVKAFPQPHQSRFTNLPKVNADEIRARAAENERLGVRRANF